MTCGFVLGKHGPNQLGDYLHIHHACMRKLIDDGFVMRDPCVFEFLPASILLDGIIECAGNIRMQVFKEIDVLDGSGISATVKTRRFNYNAYISGGRNIFRYDSPVDHRPFYHKHVFDTFGTGSELRVVRLDDEAAVPTLGQALIELQKWFWDHADELAADGWI